MVSIGPRVNASGWWCYFERFRNLGAGSSRNLSEAWLLQDPGFHPCPNPGKVEFEEPAHMGTGVKGW